MILQNGITSFFLHRQIPEFAFADFKKIVFATAPQLGFEISDLTERGVTPNFHTAILARPNDLFAMLGHSNYPIIAFADPIRTGSCALRFRDAYSMGQRIVEMFPHVTIATATELSRKFEESDLEQLNRAERQQIKYWKPQTIGELAFNWWD